MSASGYLAPPEQKPQQADLWNQTWRHLDRFLPNLREELFPETTGKSGATAMKSPTRARPPTPASASTTKTQDKQNEKKNSVPSGEANDKDGST
jgi:golgi-specific brefeldin A-resistance guanine nucleotide exchange factor 1